MPKKPAKRVKAGTSRLAAADRKARFVEAYLSNGGNAAQAAITAGYSAKRARATGAEFVADRNIFAEIERRRSEVLAKAQESTGLTVERTLREVARLAYFDPRKLYDDKGNLKAVVDLDDDTAAALASVEVTEEFEGRGEARESVGFTKKIKHWDKNAALEKAMRFHALYEKDNRQVGEGFADRLIRARGRVK